jgi:hypothetical protein
MIVNIVRGEERGLEHFTEADNFLLMFLISWGVGRAESQRESILK